MKKAEYVRAYQDTKESCRQYGGSYKNTADYEPTELPEWSQIIKYVEGDDIARGPPRGTSKVTVTNKDTLEYIAELRRKRVLLLADISNSKPGGEVESAGDIKAGVPRQEEDLYRRTDYSNRINYKYYPIKSNHFIVTEGVTVYKDSSYKRLKTENTIDILGMPSVVRPNLRDGTYMDESDRQNMQTRIDLFFRYAALEKYKTLVLGAFGSPMNPPADVAKMYSAAIEKYGGYFREIIISVPCTPKDDAHKIFKVYKETVKEQEGDNAENSEEEDSEEYSSDTESLLNYGNY